MFGACTRFRYCVDCKRLLIPFVWVDCTQCVDNKLKTENYIVHDPMDKIDSEQLCTAGDSTYIVNLVCESKHSPVSLTQPNV